MVMAKKGSLSLEDERKEEMFWKGKVVFTHI